MELSVFDSTMPTIEGVRFTKNALIFSRIDGLALQSVGGYLQAIDACAAWWWGDLMAAYCGYRLKKDEADGGGSFDDITRQEKMKQYSAHYSAICGKEPKTLAHWKGVAEFYNSSRRREELTWSHHAEAKDGAEGDQAVADNWLDAAERHGWSVSELRAAIRKAKRETQEPSEPMPQLVLPMELVEARRYATTAINRVDDMEISEARALLAELTPLLQFAVALERRVGNGQPLPATPGKESLRRAS